MAYLVILTKRQHKILAVLDQDGRLPLVENQDSAAALAASITGIDAYDSKTGLGWLLINKIDDDNVILLPEEVKLAQPYQWTDIEDEVIPEEIQMVLLKIVRKL